MEVKGAHASKLHRGAGILYVTDAGISNLPAEIAHLETAAGMVQLRNPKTDG